MKINYLNDDVHQSVYILQGKSKTILIVIPDWNWSIELSDDIQKQDYFELLLMQLFVFKDEEEAEQIAQQLTEWIETYKKEND